MAWIDNLHEIIGIDKNTLAYIASVVTVLSVPISVGAGLYIFFAIRKRNHWRDLYYANHAELKAKEDEISLQKKKQPDRIAREIDFYSKHHSNDTIQSVRDYFTKYQDSLAKMCAHSAAIIYATSIENEDINTLYLSRNYAQIALLFDPNAKYNRKLYAEIQATYIEYTRDSAPESEVDRAWDQVLSYADPDASVSLEKLDKYIISNLNQGRYGVACILARRRFILTQQKTGARTDEKFRAYHNFGRTLFESEDFTGAERVFFDLYREASQVEGRWGY